MAPVPTPPLPGSMTVPPWFGWDVLLAILVALVAVAVAFFIAAAVGTGADSRSEWQAGLDARSSRAQDPGPDPHEPAADPVTPPAGPLTADSAGSEAPSRL
jgi:hypothetical protein